MKKTQVKTHRRGGKVVRSHSRTMKGKEGGFDKEMCIAKYKKIVDEKGKNDPMAKKLLAKLEANGEDTTTIRKHARIDQVFMRKKIDPEVLTKESKTRKHARTTLNKSTGKFESTGRGSADKGVMEYASKNGFTDKKRGNINKKINQKANIAEDEKSKWSDRRRDSAERSDNVGKGHNVSGEGRKSQKRTDAMKKEKAMSGKVKNPKTGRMVSKEYLDKDKFKKSYSYKTDHSGENTKAPKEAPKKVIVAKQKPKQKHKFSS